MSSTKLSLDVNQLVTAMFREYLARHKLDGTKAAFEKEVPRVAGELSSRAEMAKWLGLTSIFELSRKKHGKNMPSILELLAQEIVDSQTPPGEEEEEDDLLAMNAGSLLPDNSNSNTQKPTSLPPLQQQSAPKPMTSFGSSSLNSSSSFSTTNNAESSKNNDSHVKELPGKKQLRREDFMVMNKKYDHITRQAGDIAGQQFVIDGITNCTISLQDHSAQISVDYATDSQVEIGPCEGSVFLRDCKNCSFVIACRQFRSRDCENCDITLFCTTDPIIETSTGMKFMEWTVERDGYTGVEAHFAAAGLDASPSANKWDRIFDFNKDQEVHGQATHFELVRPSSMSTTAATTLKSQPQKAAQVEESLVIEDCDDLDMDMGDINNSSHSADDGVNTVLPRSTRRIDRIEATAVKSLIFGKTGGLVPDAWVQQDVTALMSSRKARLGVWCIEQAEGGPCGVLAAVQAFMLYELLYVQRKRILPNVSAAQAKSALAAALGRMLDQCASQAALESGNAKTFVVARKDATAHGSDFGAYTLHEFGSLADTIAQFSARAQITTLEVVLSLIYSRGGIDAVKSDFDETAAALIGIHSYGTQELVNLCIFGRAHSQCIDGSLDDIGVRGAPHQTLVGFLTLHEHYGNVQVGQYMKEPKVPIWVVCSESHYSVLFELDAADINNDRSDTSVVHLWYYDGLARQDDVIEFTVDCNGDVTDESDAPLENVIRTRWPGAVIDWNGAERLL